MKKVEENIHNNFIMKSFAEEDRPREKLLKNGVKSLTNTELLAILLHTGSINDNALSLAFRILRENNNSLKQIILNDVSGLKKLKGIGNAKAVTIIAAIELGIRCSNENSNGIIFLKTSKDIYSYIWPTLGLCKYEEFWVIYLARNLKVISKQMIGEGGINSTIVDPRKIFKVAIDVLASSIILCHNHPSGNTTPSVQDRQITQKMIEIGKLVDINVIDHLIITSDGYYSFAENGDL
ncbi:DNA repair protein RadC [Bacteroidales bacterium OttesenSCG-928-K03]|nr:DNA repair protein RadC [Bacteroidales bacterium OttesenSCG-928-K03]